VLSQIPEIGSEYQVHLERRGDGRDYLILKVERRPDIEADQNEALARGIAHDIRRQILVSAEVEIKDYSTLPRTERKSRRIFDHRN
jgi:phenylacetate-CoA ligase